MAQDRRKPRARACPYRLGDEDPLNLWRRSRTATGAPSAVPRTPARLAGWGVREAVLALAGEGGTRLAPGPARDRRPSGGARGVRGTAAPGRGGGWGASPG